MTVAVRSASEADHDALLALQRAFYAEDRIVAHANTAQAFAALLRDASIGGVLVLEEHASLLGYVVWTLGYSLEAGGRDAFIDELFVRPTHRRLGFGRRLLTDAIERASAAGVLAIHLEMAEPDAAKRGFYESLGFALRPHPLMSRRR